MEEVLQSSFCFIILCIKKSQWSLWSPHATEKQVTKELSL